MHNICSLTNYTGPSMNPTLKVGDGMKLVPYGKNRVNAGDVAVFYPPGSDEKVVHRVITVSSEGIKTRGDNNSHADGWLLQADDIIGRVVSVQRGHKHLTIRGGFRGLLWANALWAVKRVRPIIGNMLRPFYYRLLQTHSFKNLLKTRVLYFQRPTGTEMQLVMGNRVVGSRKPGQNRWQIQRPYRLFIDESSLPKAPEHMKREQE